MSNDTWVCGVEGGGDDEGSDVCLSVCIADFLEMTIKIWYNTSTFHLSPFIHPSICPSMHSSFHVPIHPSIHLFIPR